MAGLMRRFSLTTIALTDGSRPALLFHLASEGLQASVLHLPRVDVVNAIGCGDTAAGGLLHFLLEGMEPAKAFQCALAMASAAACTDSSAFYDVEVANSLVDRITLQTLILSEES